MDWNKETGVADVTNTKAVLPHLINVQKPMGVVHHTQKM